jgi:hypothetical protein
MINQYKKNVEVQQVSCYALSWKCHNRRPDTTPPPAHPFLLLNCVLYKQSEPSQDVLDFNKFHTMLSIIIEVSQQVSRHHRVVSEYIFKFHIIHFSYLFDKFHNKN